MSASPGTVGVDSIGGPGNAQAGPSRLGLLDTSSTPSYGYPDESPLSALTDGFSTATRYGASASSPGAGSESDGQSADYFVSVNGEETEIEAARRRRRAQLPIASKRKPGSRSGSGDGDASDKLKAKADVLAVASDRNTVPKGTTGSYDAGRPTM